MEKASSLSEAEDNLDPIPSGDSIDGSGVRSGVSGEVSGRHPRSLKPVESGVFSGVSSPVSGEQLVESLQSALSAASRSEAGLGSLHRSVRDASRALTASRHAHESLTEELRVMYRGLNEVMSEKAAIERYAALLTQERDAALDAAEEARREAKREREFLLREQDRFIQLLLEEHEAELQTVRQGFAFPQSARSALDAAVSPTTSPGIAPAVRPFGAAPSASAIEPSPVRSVTERSVTERSVEERSVTERSVTERRRAEC